MQWTIPGTTLTGQREEADRIEELFQSLFLAGGLTLSQVSSITGLESYTIQNWVKRKFLGPPKQKRYDMEQVCRLMNMNILKGTVPLEQIIHLMEYLNGDLASEEDDLVDDTRLFFLFVKLSARACSLDGSRQWEEALEEITRDYREPQPGAREKLIRVLKIMMSVWCANQMRLQAQSLIAQL